MFLIRLTICKLDGLLRTCFVAGIHARVLARNNERQQINWTQRTKRHRESQDIDKEQDKNHARPCLAGAAKFTLILR